MKLKDQIKIIITTLFIITPIYSEQPLNRRASIKDIAHDVIQINQHIDQLMDLRAHMRNQREIARILKDIDTLKTLRDLKIRELNKLRKQNFTQMKQNN